MALIVTHLQDKKSVYLQDKDGNEVEFIRADDLRKLAEKWRKEHKDEHYYHAGLFADELEELLEEVSDERR